MRHVADPVFSSGVDPALEFYLLNSSGCQPDGLPPTLKFIRQLHDVKDSHSPINMLADTFISILLSIWINLGQID